jgi:hypothetical protein
MPIPSIPAGMRHISRETLRRKFTYQPPRHCYNGLSARIASLPESATQRATQHSPLHDPQSHHILRNRHLSSGDPVASQPLLTVLFRKECAGGKACARRAAQAHFASLPALSCQDMIRGQDVVGGRTGRRRDVSVLARKWGWRSLRRRSDDLREPGPSPPVMRPAARIPWQPFRGRRSNTSSRRRRGPLAATGREEDGPADHALFPDRHGETVYLGPLEDV